MKTEVVVTPDTEELDSIQLASIDKDVIEISLEEEEEEIKTEAERISIDRAKIEADRAKIEADRAKIEADRAKIAAKIKASFERQAKDWD